MRAQSVVVSMALFVLLVCTVVGAAAAAAGVGDQCSNDFEKLVTCLNYATGKAAAPTAECCSSVTEIKGKDPACLCYVIEQTYNGSEEVKSMGIQESRLLLLPSVCKLTNASISDCPKLLNIPASSPEYKIFANHSSPSTTTTGTSEPIKAGDSSGSTHRPQLAGLVPIAMAIFFFYAVPIEIVSTFYA